MRQFDVQTKQSRTGAMLALICLMVIVLVFMAAMSIDVARMQLARTELRTATDAAARAAAGTLSRQQNELDATTAGVTVAQLNTIDNIPLQLSESDLVFGSVLSSASGIAQFNAAGMPKNAVRILGRRTDDAPSGSVPLFFGGLMGIREFQPSQQAVAARVDRDIALVLDRSGSMGNGDRWEALSNAIDEFVDQLIDTDEEERVSVIGYSSTATVAQVLTNDMSKIGDAFDSMSAAGSTAIGLGLLAGSDSLIDDPMARPYAAKTIIIMTDGNHNQDINPQDAVDTAVLRNQTVHTITFGSGANQALMLSVADEGHGIHLHAPDAQALEDAFSEIALTLPVIMAE